MRSKKGQSTVEYLILLGGIIVILIIFLRPGGIFQQSYNRTLIRATDGMEDMANRLAKSRPTS
jgi:uncharacterized protein (UPF0333 family)